MPYFSPKMAIIILMLGWGLAGMIFVLSTHHAQTEHLENRKNAHLKQGKDEHAQR